MNAIFNICAIQIIDYIMMEQQVKNIRIIYK